MNENINRVILIVLDSVGIGALPDAASYGDTGANTLVHIAQQQGGIKLVNMNKMGLGNVVQAPGLTPVDRPLASYGRMLEVSKGKDTMTGHWELMGLLTDNPFPVFPQGFGEEILGEFLKVTGFSRVLGNKAASGTVIIQELGEEHVKTGLPIVYTSADSVFQVAAHEEIIPIPELYKICEKARKICDKHMIGRVIARPFLGQGQGNFTRTANRKDFPMKPHGKTALDLVKEQGLPVTGIGKIEDIYVGCGITRAIHTHDNPDGMKRLLEELDITREGIIFINLVDFDMIYGHRNNVAGYAKALEDFDSFLTELLPKIGDSDLLMITADHGCDPTHPGTDHTREYVPLLAYNPLMTPRDLGTRQTFADVGVTILEAFGMPHPFKGKSIIG